MPFHFCIDELLAILMVVPFIGMTARRVYNWWHGKCACPEHDIDKDAAGSHDKTRTSK